MIFDDVFCYFKCLNNVVALNRPISEQNVGHKLLSKMGWKEGEGLGKNREDAIIEPVKSHVHLSFSLVAYVC